MKISCSSQSLTAIIVGNTGAKLAKSYQRWMAAGPWYIKKIGQIQNNHSEQQLVFIENYQFFTSCQSFHHRLHTKNANCAILWLHIFLLNHVIVDAGMQMLSLLVKDWRLQSGVAGFSWYGGVELDLLCCGMLVFYGIVWYCIACWYGSGLQVQL